MVIGLSRSFVLLKNQVELFLWKYGIAAMAGTAVGLTQQ